MSSCLVPTFAGVPRASVVNNVNEVSMISLITKDTVSEEMWR